jgi:hypothetical protein
MARILTECGTRASGAPEVETSGYWNEASARLKRRTGCVLIFSLLQALFG